MIEDDRKARYYLDEVDSLILAELSKNARASLKEISRKLGVPTSTVFTRIRKLEDKGIIKRYTVIVDPQKLGYTITAVIHFSVEGPYLEQIEKNLSQHPNIIGLYDTTGDFDIIAIVRFRSMDELDRFIKNTLRNPHIKKTITNMVLRTVKEQQPSVPLEEKIE